MLEDKFLTYCKRKYAVKVGALIQRKIDREYLEYTYSQFDISERKKLYDFLSLEVPIHIKTFTNEWMQEKLSDIESSSDGDDWGREVTGLLFKSHKLKNKFWDLLMEIFMTKQTPKRPTMYQKNLSKLQEIFNLGSIESDIVTFLFLENTDDSVSDYLAG